jgi:hypothetical protein
MAVGGENNCTQHQSARVGSRKAASLRHGGERQGAVYQGGGCERANKESERGGCVMEKG